MTEKKITTVDEKREQIKQEIQHALDTEGIWQRSTCPTGAGYGWDIKLHYALEQIQRNPPEGWHVSRIYVAECYDWTVVKQ